MDDNQVIFDISKVPEEGDTVEEAIVKLNRQWAFWENYDAKAESAKLDYAESMKKIFLFDDLITFWQFWNNYPGSTPGNIFYNDERIRQ